MTCVLKRNGAEDTRRLESQRTWRVALGTGRNQEQRRLGFSFCFSLAQNFNSGTHILGLLDCPYLNIERLPAETVSR